MHTEELISEITWIFGRGASLSCGLNWNENAEVLDDRIERIKKIDANLSREMQNVPIGNNPYSQLLSLLQNKTKPNQKHFFITTNWDYLLQREINNIITDKTCPPWLLDSHVFHLNGSVEKWDDGRHRTPIALPDDKERIGASSLEFSKAMNFLVSTRLFVVIGLSFSCKVDIRLIEFLKPYEDEMPFGEGRYLIVNNYQQDLDHLGNIIKNNFPRADVVKIASDFKSWVNAQCPNLWQ